MLVVQSSYALNLGYGDIAVGIATKTADDVQWYLFQHIESSLFHPDNSMNWPLVEWKSKHVIFAAPCAGLFTIFTYLFWSILRSVREKFKLGMESSLFLLPFQQSLSFPAAHSGFSSLSCWNYEEKKSEMSENRSWSLRFWLSSSSFHALERRDLLRSLRVLCLCVFTSNRN